MDITQEDCISAHRVEKKRKTPTGPSATQPSRCRLVPSTAPRAPPRSNLPGRWAARPPQQARFNRPPTPQPQQQQQQGPRPSFPPVNQGNSNYRCFNCRSPSHFIKDCPQPRKSFQGQTSNPTSKGKGKKQVVQVRQGRVNLTTLSELPKGTPIMTGTFSINHQPVIILLDSGATHDEDITPTDIQEAPSLDIQIIQAPITRARARQLNLEVSSLLSVSVNNYENGLLPNFYNMIRNQGEVQGTHGKEHGGVEEQQGPPSHMETQYNLTSSPSRSPGAA
jgi:hypothetical protein